MKQHAYCRVDNSKAGALMERAFPRPRDEARASKAGNEHNHIVCSALMCGKGRFHGAET